MDKQSHILKETKLSIKTVEQSVHEADPHTTMVMDGHGYDQKKPTKPRSHV
ncbi:MAG: hypothetical protein PHH38_01180 [Candidatus Cloacimonetes bacterium]|nr:hypothetical protein [Candidatus Cloacimonadota bacterium]